MRALFLLGLVAGHANCALSVEEQQRFADAVRDAESRKAHIINEEMAGNMHTWGGGYNAPETVDAALVNAALNGPTDDTNWPALAASARRRTAQLAQSLVEVENSHTGLQAELSAGISHASSSLSLEMERHELFEDHIEKAFQATGKIQKEIAYLDYKKEENQLEIAEINQAWAELKQTIETTEEMIYLIPYEAAFATTATLLTASYHEMLDSMRRIEELQEHLGTTGAEYDRELDQLHTEIGTLMEDLEASANQLRDNNQRVEMCENMLQEFTDLLHYFVSDIVPTPVSTYEESVDFRHVGTGFCLDNDGNRYDFYSKANVPDLETCKQACLNTTSCTSITWRGNLNRCHLESRNVVLDHTQSMGGSRWHVTAEAYTGDFAVNRSSGLLDHDCWRKVWRGGGGAAGDPHIERLDGTKFELEEDGEHMLLLVPKNGDEIELTGVVATLASSRKGRMGHYLTELYVSGSAVGGRVVRFTSQPWGVHIGLKFYTLEEIREGQEVGSSTVKSSGDMLSIDTDKVKFVVTFSNSQATDGFLELRVEPKVLLNDVGGVMKPIKKLEKIRVASATALPEFTDMSVIAA